MMDGVGARGDGAPRVRAKKKRRFTKYRNYLYVCVLDQPYSIVTAQAQAAPQAHETMPCGTCKPMPIRGSTPRRRRTT